MEFEFEIDKVYAAGIVKANCSDMNGVNFSFHCLVPLDLKESEVSDYVSNILNAIKEKVEQRKTWRFVETHRRNNSKPYRRPFGTLVKPVLNEAISKKKQNGKEKEKKKG